ncbi:MAG: F0F1 ATP synthase subunit B/delta [Actinomycetota bacterium]|nr:F0F1 ATP synthase subunit B/delta [Actinomycetota bacterium]
MSTFIGQLIGFGVIVFIIMKYAAPPVKKLMAAQQEAVRTQLDESAKAALRLADADRYHAERLENGRIEASQIVDEASSDSLRIAELLRQQGSVESERLKVYGDQQVIQLRAQRIRELRALLGSDALRRAGEIVRGRVADPQERSATVDRFLDELEAMAPVPVAPELSPTDLRPASRDAQAAVVARFDVLSTSMSVDDLSQLAAELAAVASLLLREPILARHLAEISGAADAKRAMLDQLLAGRVGTGALDILVTATSERWSTTEDFVQCLEHVARLCLLERAKRESQADEVAEQLFRFGRVLEAESKLTALLSDYREPASARVALLRSIVDGGNGANTTVLALLAQTVELLHGERADNAVHDLTSLAVARQGEIVAQVSAAAELSQTQRQRLTDVLTRIYGHPVSVHLIIDPAPLGGLSVAIGDEVIDGTLSSRLAAAATRLPD